MWCSICKCLADSVLCEQCREALHKVGYAYLYNDRCKVCNQSVLDSVYGCPNCLDNLLVYGPYESLLASLINRYKQGGELQLLPLLSELYVPMIKTIAKPLLLPIPSSLQGRKARGFDQMMKIASYLQKKYEIPYLNVFTHTRTRQYKQLNRLERSSYISLKLSKTGSSKLEKVLAEGFQPVIIDDIRTTGFTSTQASILIENTYSIKTKIIVLADA